MTGFIVLDRNWAAVQQKELATFEEAAKLAEVCAKNQRNGPYKLVQVVGVAVLVPESVEIQTQSPVTVASSPTYNVGNLPSISKTKKGGEQ